jgi:hypothetical protein
MQVIDKTGSVYLCASVYPMYDPISGHVYQPGALVKVDSNAWIEGQIVLVKQEEPKQVTEVEKPAVEQPVKKTTTTQK